MRCTRNAPMRRWALLVCLAFGCGDDDGGNARPDAGDGSELDADVDIDAMVDAGPYMGPRAAKIVAENRRACAILDDGTLKCWGEGVATPVTIDAGSTFKQVAIGGQTCAIKSDDTLWCWTSAAPTLVQVAGTYAAVAVGDDHACAITLGKTLACWGSNNQGQLGLGHYMTGPTTPTAIIGDNTDWSTVTAGEEHTCALKTSGALWCWGGATNLTHTPAAVHDTETFIDLSIVGSGTMVVRSDGTFLRGSGANIAVYNGIPSTWKLVRETYGAGIHTHRCGLRNDNTLFCWGSNWRGQIGLVETGAPQGATTPTQVGDVGEYVDVAIGNRFTCGIKTDGSVRCFGAAAMGQLGDGRAIAPRTTPVKISNAGEWASLYANQARTCGVKTDGTLACWGGGFNSLDQAYFDVQRPMTPAQAGTGGTNIGAVSLGISHSCVRRTNNMLACWGSNGSGEVGVGNTMLVTGGATDTGLSAKAFSLGYLHTCATGLDDRLYCWGNHTYNRLGFTASAFVTTPTLVGTDTWTSLAGSYSNTCGIRSDGTLHCWGFSFTNFEQLTQDTTWTSLATTPNDNQYWAIKAGVPHSWSGNGGSKVPYPLMGATNWVSMSANYSHQCGVRSDGTLQCIGANTNGELGDGTTTMRTSAVQVGTDTDWTSVAVGYFHTCGIRAGGTLYCWGASNSGEIGDGMAWTATPVTVAL